MFYGVYGSKFCKEPIDKLMYGMTLPEFLSYKNYIDIKNAFEEAGHKDQEEEIKRSNNGR